MKEEHRRIYRAAFDFQEAHQPPPGATHEWWVQLAKDAGKALLRLNNDPFAVGMFDAVIKQLERETVSREPAQPDKT